VPVKKNPFLEGEVNAPDFPPVVEWLNTRHVLSACATCAARSSCSISGPAAASTACHIIPDLKRLEAKYPGQLVVIGVHSAKFTTEKGTDNIRQAILRYEIEHPVINDKDFRGLAVLFRAPGQLLS
jgi:hypothetical protein